MIELLDVSKRFGSTLAVDRVTLRIEPATLTVLIGASGSGKSTLLRLINRLVEADSGQIRIEGVAVRSQPVDALRRRIGYVIQSTGLFPHWTVARNIATVPRLLGWNAAQISARVDELLELLGLGGQGLRERFPHQLSGGQQQRVGVARALAARPALLLMDEPFGAVDPLTRRALQRELAALQRTMGCTIVLVTHDIDEALLLGQQLVLLEQGRIVQAGTPAQLLGEPVDARVDAFFGAGGAGGVGQRLLALRRVGEMVRAGEAAGGQPLSAEQNLQQALDAFLLSRQPSLPVVDGSGRRLGAIHFADLLRHR